MAIKHCEICGKEFIDYGRGKYCQGPHYKSCAICGKLFEYDCRAQKIPKTCSSKCSGKLAIQNTSYREKTCFKCGKLFMPNSGRQKFCESCTSDIDS